MRLPRARAASPGAQTRPRPEGSRGADPELSLGRTFGSISALPWYLRTGTTTDRGSSSPAGLDRSSV